MLKFLLQAMLLDLPLFKTEFYFHIKHASQTIPKEYSIIRSNTEQKI